MSTNGKDKKRNYLSDLCKRRLQDWIFARWEQYSADKPRQTTVAKMATESLGFPVTPANLVGAAKALGYDWPKREPPPALLPEPDTVQDRLQTLEISVNRLILGLSVLYERLGEPGPDIPEVEIGDAG